MRHEVSSFMYPYSHGTAISHDILGIKKLQNEKTLNVAFGGDGGTYDISVFISHAIIDGK